MMPVMAAISGIEPAAGMHHNPPREEKGGRAAADFGVAVTHRDVVQERRRVDPTALTDKQRAMRSLRSDDETRRDERQRSGKGGLLDIEV